MNKPSKRLRDVLFYTGFEKAKTHFDKLAWAYFKRDENTEVVWLTAYFVDGVFNLYPQIRYRQTISETEFISQLLNY